MNIDIPIAKPIDVSECAVSANKKLNAVINWLKEKEYENLAPGKTEIMPDTFAILGESKLREKSDAKLESHKVYTDLQYIIDGEESFGIKPVSQCENILKHYDAERDICFYSDEFENIQTLRAGQFIILPPDCAHAPLIGLGSVKKCIVKIRL